MLSYRHAFHAGNAADVLKHSVLIFCLEYLARKEKPLLCVDTHAGAGGYRLHEGYAAQKREWETGVGRLPALESPPPLLRRYLEICLPAGTGNAPAEYPGSPAIMARLLRPADRLVCFELHPADYAACAALLADRAEVRRADGFAGLTGLLPPPSRRGLILIDPPYEVKEDYARVSETTARALRRFATGTYLIWYPLLRNPPAGAAGLPARLLEQYNGSRCRVELYTAAPDAPPENSPRGMYGSGLAIYNPPWTLRAALEESLPALAALVGRGNGGWKIECGQ
jgi:23S rRNA (adenine2030-N6)-methyltransferase